MQERRQLRLPVRGPERERHVARAVEHQHAVVHPPRRLGTEAEPARVELARALLVGDRQREVAEQHQPLDDEQRDLPRVAHEQALGALLVGRAGRDDALAQGRGGVGGEHDRPLVQADGRRPATGGTLRPRQTLKPRWWW